MPILQKKNTPEPAQLRSDNAGPAASGKTMSPPGFNLSAEQTSAPVQAKGDPTAMKEHRDITEYQNQTGPVAEKGTGDANAFDKSDVNQGALGDCYLLASLMTLASQSPDILKNAISGPKADGSYDVSLYKRKGGFIGIGKSLQKQTVNVESSFLVYNAEGNKKGMYGNAYAQGGDMDSSGNQELWVKLIEKAYGKMNGGFQKINGGWSEVALEALTGKEYSETGFQSGLFGIGGQNTDDMKKAIKEAMTAGGGITCSTKSQKKVDKEDDKDFAKNNDIVGGHAYSIVSADDTNIRVRNPWGAGTLTPEVTMTWAQFRKFFRSYTTKD